MTVAIQERREAAAAAGAEMRARLEVSHRREAARTLATTSAGKRCPSCQGPVVHGQTVRVAHAPGCRRRAAIVGAAHGLAERLCAAVSTPAPAVPDGSQPSQVPVPPTGSPGVESAQLEGRERHPYWQRRQHHSPARNDCVYTSQAPAIAEEQTARRREQEIGRAEEQETRRHGGIRPWVVLRWFVSGARVLCSGWLATVRRIVRDCSGGLCAWVEFDDCDGRWLHPLDDLEPGWAVAA